MMIVIVFMVGVISPSTVRVSVVHGRRPWPPPPQLFDQEAVHDPLLRQVVTRKGPISESYSHISGSMRQTLRLGGPTLNQCACLRAPEA